MKNLNLLVGHLFYLDLSQLRTNNGVSNSKSIRLLDNRKQIKLEQLNSVNTVLAGSFRYPHRIKIVISKFTCIVLNPTKILLDLVVALFHYYLTDQFNKGTF